MGDVSKEIGVEDVLFPGVSAGNKLATGGDFLGIGGGGGGDYEEPQSSKIAAQIAQQLFQETSPIRESVYGDLTDFLGGDFNISENPAWSPGKLAIEDQYQVAKDNILANLPKGGQLNEALSEADLSRAKTLTELIGNIEGDMYNKAYGVATQTPQTSISGLLGSGSVAAQSQATQAAADAGKDQMMGDAAMAAAFLI